MRDVERDDIEFISRTLGCLPIAHVDHMRPEKLGHAKLVEEETVRSEFLALKGFLLGFGKPERHKETCHSWPPSGV